MKIKNRRKTDGLPFTLGIAAGVAALLEVIISFSITPITTEVTNAYLTTLGYSTASSGMTNSFVWAIVGFVIKPGIFLLLLILGKNKEKRGSAFAVVWIIFSLISILSLLSSTTFFVNATLKQQIIQAVNTVMPGGYWIENALSLISSVLMLASCILFLKRLHTPPMPGTVIPPENQGPADGI